jgi:hypothetical protein
VWWRRSIPVPMWTLALVVVALLAAVSAAFLASRDRGPTIVRGVITAVNSDGTAIGFTSDGSSQRGRSYPVGAGPWTDKNGQIVDGTRPSCLASGQRVELGIENVSVSGNWASEQVVWVHCLS